MEFSIFFFWYFRRKWKYNYIRSNFKFNRGLLWRAGLLELNGASIENLVLDVDISRDESGGTGYIGGLAGEMAGDTIVSRVAVDGAITIDSGSGREYVGGLIGRMFGGSNR